MSVLDQLSVNYTYQLSKKKLEWCGSFIYDFYLEVNGKNIIIETNGRQHYEENGLHKLGNYTFAEQQENDYTKRQLALSNNVNSSKYVRKENKKKTKIKEKYLSIIRILQKPTEMLALNIYKEDLL